MMSSIRERKKRKEGRNRDRERKGTGKRGRRKKDGVPSLTHFLIIFVFVFSVSLGQFSRWLSHLFVLFLSLLQILILSVFIIALYFFCFFSNFLLFPSFDFYHVDLFFY